MDTIRRTPLQSLREAFDQAFAAAPSETEPEEEALVAVRAGTDRLAFRLAEIAALEVDRAVVPLPSAAVDLLGLAGIHGRLVPVYSLAALLGTHATRAERWLVVCRAGIRPGTPEASDLVGLAVEALDGIVRAPRAGLHAVVPPDPARPHVSELAVVAGQIYAVVSVPSILTSIHGRLAGARKEP